ncbi:protein RST1 isoform X1 [Elaeis guineensis]|uniref:Protein RST1 isoform X1 n=1 Tax=Elaeis guineensis var. tenera TaxID=51953 RepID=A0A6I9SBE9_ELAGV|nr:protein RST1 isoform X1 [Elaeis guineensis]
MEFYYGPLLEKTRVPQPSFQRLAVVSIFQKLRAAPPPLGPDSGPARHALSHCLHSPSAAVADQAVRELCRLVRDGHLTASAGLVELQSSLEGCVSGFAPVFVKGIGFLVRFAFKSDPSWGRRFDHVELHPFVKVLSCQVEIQAELIQQVMLFIAQNKSVGIEAISKFLRPFLAYSVLRKQSSSFVRDLISSIASLSCSFLSEAACIMKLLTGCLKYFPCSNEGDFKYLIACAEYLVDAFMVLLKKMVSTQMVTTDARACTIELLETLLSLCTGQHKLQGRTEIILELSKRLLVSQKELGLHYLSEFMMVTVSISILLTQVEFEHEQLFILKLLNFLVEWKTENEINIKRTANCISEELLCVFPVINLLSSPSKSVKAAATCILSKMDRLLLDLPVAPGKPLISDAIFPSISTPESILFRLLHHLWFKEHSSYRHSFFIPNVGNDASTGSEIYEETKCWTSLLKKYLSTLEKQKMTLPAQPPECSLTGISWLLGSITTTLVMHPKHHISAVDCLAAIGKMDPKLGMPLLLSILFYNKILCSSGSDSPDMLLKLLEMLPSLALHSMMVPIIMQTILPMLHRDAKPVLYAAAVRLLCKTWIVTDRAFGTLQGVLDPEAFSVFIAEREICISVAASIRDVCRHNPDRGVDLILSVSSCIESRDPIVQAFGLESLAHLCEADVVDFYTAWNVISKHMLDHSVDPIVAHGLCTLLRWGAMDAEAYPEAAKTVVHILWEVGTSRSHSLESLWVKARVAAFKSLSHYEVAQIQDKISDFKRRNFQCLISEDNVEVLKAMEEFQVKIIKFEHITRRRLYKEKRVMVHKVEKLLDAFPQAMFSPGERKHVELPGAALLSLVFTPKDLIGNETSKDFRKLHSVYEKTLLEIAESLHTSRNILFALLALQSWKPFIHHWMRAVVILTDAKTSSDALDKSSRAASNIFKTMCKVAAESTPRVAVNMAFAIGALCMVVPSSAHAVISAASNFLLKWLFEYEHEHQQWSAALSLGLVSNCFHATDRMQKFEVINGLLQVICNSKSPLVKGACGVGLGFACQDLLTRAGISEDSEFDGSARFTETELLHYIISTLSRMICQLCPSTSVSFEGLNDSFPLTGYEASTSDLSLENCDKLEEDAWGLAGLVLGLGSCVVALYRLGAYDAVLKIKNMLVSWILHINSPTYSSLVCNELAEIPLCMGSCLALPKVVAFCQRVELVDSNLDTLNLYTSLISDLLNLKKSGTLYQNLLMTSSVGAGSLLSCILNDGVQSIRFDDVRHLLEILRNTYTHPSPPPVCLGGMLGVVNAFGAGAGDLTELYPQPITLQINHEQETTFIRGPILSSPVCETLSTSMVQEMFLVAKDSKDQHIKQYAAWAISFLRHRWWSKEFQNVDGSQTSSIDFHQSSKNFAEESLVWKLCLWLNDMNYNKIGEIPHASTIATVLRCLLDAPRLPTFDWGAIIRRCMRYEAQLSIKVQMELAPKLLREECILFSLAHANDVSHLLHFLDELTELSRFRTLEPNLQSLLLQHLSDLLKLFSGLRVEKLYGDLVKYFNSSASSYLVYGPDQKRLLRVSFWKGIYQCLTETSEESVLLNMKTCIECLFCFLPLLTCDVISEGGQVGLVEEWSEAVRCLAEAPQDWLMDILQVPVSDLFHGGTNSGDVAKRILAKARLVRIGCAPVSELGKLRAYILNAKTEGFWWSVVVEVVAAISSAEVGIKRQWLCDALEICCITEYPATALQFIGLLAGSCCMYMPLLIINPISVLNDLPVTLPSLLSDSSWGAISGPLVDNLWSSTERICTWAARLANGNGFPRQDGIDENEASMLAFLSHVMYRTCISLKDYLPFDKQVRLANLELL